MSCWDTELYSVFGSLHRIHYFTGNKCEIMYCWWHSPITSRCLVAEIQWVVVLSIPTDLTSRIAHSIVLPFIFLLSFISHVSAICLYSAITFTTYFLIKLIKLSSLEVPRDDLRFSWVWCSFDNSGAHSVFARPDPSCFPVRGPMLEAESSSIYLHENRSY